MGTARRAAYPAGLKFGAVISLNSLQRRTSDKPQERGLLGHSSRCSGGRFPSSAQRPEGVSSQDDVKGLLSSGAEAQLHLPGGVF